MHVVVLLRLVPDTSEGVEVAESGSDIDREWIDVKLCEFDDHALEEAILLKERAGASVTALAIDGEGVDRMLQAAVARGADRAVKIGGQIQAATDTRTATALLAQAIRTLDVDLVVTGVLTTEDILGQWAPYLAARLGWPTVNAVSGVEAGGRGVIVRQEYSGGRAARLDIAFPAVLGIQSASQPPRYVPGSKLRQAMGVPIETLDASAAEPDQSAEISALAKPEAARHASMIDGDADTVAAAIVDVLVERSLV